MSTTTVTISNDPSVLGVDCDCATLERYAANLAEHLTERFSRPVSVQLRSVDRAQCSDDDVLGYVDELSRGEGWIQFVPSRKT